MTPGEYYVRFILPFGWEFTLQNVGPDDTDSDASPNPGETDSTFLDLDTNPIDRTLDAGMYRDVPWEPPPELTRDLSVGGEVYPVDKLDLLLNWIKEITP